MPPPPEGGEREKEKETEACSEKGPAHLVVDLERLDALPVENFHGDGLPGLDVARVFHLPEVPLPERPPDLVLP